MRSHFAADWAFGIKGAIENVVRSNYPTLLRSWPILQTFNFEAFRLGNYAVFILRDKLSGTPSGPGELLEFPYTGYLDLPPKTEEIEIWHHYFKVKFSLRREDFAFLIPIHDCGKNDAALDFQLFSDEEKQFWNYQLSYNISNYHSYLESLTNKEPKVPTIITYNVSGNNTRVNINSHDNSTNVVQKNEIEVFEQLRNATNELDDLSKVKILEAINLMEEDLHRQTFVDRYKNFISLIADHMQVFAAYIPALSEFIIK